MSICFFRNAEGIIGRCRGGQESGHPQRDAAPLPLAPITELSASVLARRTPIPPRLAGDRNHGRAFHAPNRLPERGVENNNRPTRKSLPNLMRLMFTAAVAKSSRAIMFRHTVTKSERKAPCFSYGDISEPTI